MNLPRPWIQWDGTKGRVVQSPDVGSHLYSIRDSRTGDEYTLAFPCDMRAALVPNACQLRPILNRYAEQLGAALVPSLLAR